MAHSPEPLTSTLRSDVIAGLTAAAVVLPKAMAYATVAGLSVSVGLYTAFVPMIIYALLGTSRVLSVSSTTTLAILTGVELGTVVSDGDPAKLTIAAATLTALTGVLLIGASVLRLGFLANFISTPVLTGFKAGIGMVIVLDQLSKLLGIHITKQGFFRDVVSVAQHVPDTSLITLGVGAATLIALFALERLKPHSAAPLFVVGGGIAASWLFDLSASGVATVGIIPQALPSITLPSFDLVGQLLPSAFGIALMSFTETIAAGRAFARQSEPPIKANRELLATGAANLLGAFFGAMPAGGGTSQTAVVRSVGARSQTASLVTASAAVATMLVLAPFLGFLPQTVLAAIVIVYSVGLINPPEFVAISKIRRMEFTWAIAALLGVLVFGTLQGIVVAIVLSLIGLSRQAVNSKVYVIGRKRGADVLRPLKPENPDDETIDGLLILRPEGRLFFANAQSVGDQIRALVAEHQPRVVALDMSRVPDLEYSALQMLVDGERRMTEEEGVTVWLAALNPSVLASIRASPLEARLGRERLLFNAREAIRKYQEGLAAGDTHSPTE
jgi:high affinity sulfate transporter 1